MTAPTRGKKPAPRTGERRRTRSAAGERAYARREERRERSLRELSRRPSKRQAGGGRKPTVAATRKALAELLARPLGDQRYLVLMLDGIEVADHTVVVALGITADGQKQILGLWEGATENAAVCRALLTDLVERGLRVDGGILVVIDGAKALRAAVRDVLGARATVQRCQVHKKRNVLDHLPDEARAWVSRKLEQAWRETDYEKARTALTSLAKTLDDKYPGAAASLREGLEETLTVLRLELPEALRKTLRSTNPIECV